MEPAPAKHASRALRRGALVLAAYAIGLFASWAVAWGISASQVWKAVPARPPVYGFDVDGVPGAYHLYQSFGTRVCVGGRARGALIDEFRPLPDWAFIDLTDRNTTMGTAATGWPALCLRYSWVTTSRLTGRQKVTAWIQEFRVWTPFTGPNSRLKLPLDPMASGLVINTAFYGSLLLAGCCLAPWARRALRRRRGRCSACGYDRRGLTAEPCPECGAAPA
jgi:hypothetical protein